MRTSVDTACYVRRCQMLHRIAPWIPSHKTHQGTHSPLCESALTRLVAVLLRPPALLISQGPHSARCECDSTLATIQSRRPIISMLPGVSEDASPAYTLKGIMLSQTPMETRWSLVDMPMPGTKASAAAALGVLCTAADILPISDII